MADEDKDSKTEEPTERKIQQAVDKGNVPTSREAATFATFLAIFAAGSFLLNENVARLRDTLARFIDMPGQWRLETGADAVGVLYVLAFDLARLVAPFIILLIVAGVTSALVQNPPSIASDRIKPQYSRIAIGKGVKRIFGLQGFVEFGKSLFKLTAVAAVGYAVVIQSQAEVFAALFLEPIVVPALLRDVLVRLVGWVLLLSLVLVAADLFWSRFKWRSDLRMSKEEVKEERKQSEGDPHVKARLRSLARDRARRRMIAAVPRATVVITNPTHFAIALRYHREEGGAPMVLAKGQDLVALKIREIAEAHEIPIVEDKPLARSLYDSVEVDKLIPPQFYRAVAEIIYYLHIHNRVPLSGQKA
jgi:flagellar biosynthetic protein FlhB